MSIEALKEEFSTLMCQASLACQDAEMHATGANIHDIKACIGAINTFHVALEDDRMKALGWYTERHYQFINTTIRQTIFRLNLLKIGKSRRIAEAEARNKYNPGAFPENKE